MKPRDPVVRWIDSSDGGGEVGKLLGQVPTPRKLSDIELNRIERALVDGPVVAPRSPWRWLALATPLAGAAALVAFFVLRAPIVDGPRDLTLDHAAVATLAHDGDRDLTLEGPGHATIDAQGAIRLHAGALVVRSGARPAVIDTDGARVTVRPSSHVRLEARELDLRVAAFAGSASVEWRLLDRTLTPPVEVRPHVPFARTRTDGNASAAPVPATTPASSSPAPAPPAVDNAITPRPTGHAVYYKMEPGPIARTRPTPSAPSPRATEPAHVADGEDEPMPSATPAPASATVTPAPATRDPAPVPSAPAPPVDTRLRDESQLLGQAQQRLHAAHDPRAALAILDQYASRFPHGTLHPEYEAVRVDALLQLDRAKDALATLDRMDVASQPRARELTVLRGELRATARRCREALVDFRAAQTGAADALEERALYGQASCRAQSGDWTACAADLDRYLARFPSGRFAEAARHTRESIRK